MKKAQIGNILVTFLAIAFIIGFFGILISMTTIQAGQKGVVLRWGEPTGEIFHEGLNWRTPIAEKVIIYDVKNRKITGTIDAGSRDLQSITGKVSLNYRVDSQKLIKLLSEIGRETDYIEKVLKPAMEESVKASTTRYNAEEMITKRIELRQLIREKMIEKVDVLSDSTIDVIDVNVENIAYSEEYDNAIEKKQLAEQEAKRQEYILQQKEIQAQQKIVEANATKQAKILEAEAEAESLRIQNQALAESKDVLTLRYLERWDGKLPRIITGDSGGFLYNIGEDVLNSQN